MSGVILVLSTIATSVSVDPRVVLIVQAFPLDGDAVLAMILTVFPVELTAMLVPRTPATILSVPIE